MGRDDHDEAGQHVSLSSADSAAVIRFELVETKDRYTTQKQKPNKKKTKKHFLIGLVLLHEWYTWQQKTILR